MKIDISDKMKLPLTAFGLSFYAGCIAGRYSAAVMLCAAAIFTTLCFAQKKHRLWAAGLLAGMLCMTGWECFYAQPLRKLDGTQQRVYCHIVSQSFSSEYFNVSEALCILDSRPALIKITGQYNAVPGTSIDAMVDFSAEKNNYSYSDGILLNGEVSEILSVGQPQGIFHWVYNIRNAAKQRIDSIGGDEAALAKGLMMGETDDFSLKLKRDIDYSGVNYMCAVSGTHITLCVTIIAELFFRDRRSKSYAALIISVLLIFMFNFSPSVIRAGIMLIVCQCGVLFRRESVTLNSLCVALLVMTIFTPNAAFDSALQMSALGVFGVAELAPQLNALHYFKWERFTVPAKIKEALLMSLCAVICISPVSISLFGGISIAVIPASVLLSPLFSAAVFFGVMFLLTGVGLMAEPLRLVLFCFRRIIGFFGDTDGVWVAMDFGTAVIISMLIAVLFILGVFSSEHCKALLECSCLGIVLLFSLSFANNYQRNDVGFVSNGSSGAAVICKGDEAAVLISGSGNIAEELLQYLKCHGITQLKLINAPQLDYVGLVNMQKLTELFSTDVFLCPDKLIDDVQGQITAGQYGTAEEIISVNGLSYAMLKSGDSTQADIAVYYGYKTTLPETGAVLPLYVSSRQKLLPENGINIYHINN